MKRSFKHILRCPLCKARLVSPEVASRYVYGGKPGQKFYRCSFCDVAFLHPRLSRKEEREFYKKEFEKFMEKRSGGDIDWSGPEAHFRSNAKQYERRTRFLKGLVRKNRSVLEFGCSSGFMLMPLKKAGMNVTGIEPSKCYSQFLSRQGIAVFDSLARFKASGEFRKKFDLIMHFFVLEHLREPIRFLKDCLLLLNKNGVLLFEIPSRSDPLLTVYNLAAFKKFYWSVAHNFYFNRRSLEYVLNKTGRRFKIIPEQRYGLSNHMNWAIDGKPGGQGKYSSYFSPELEWAYLQSMKRSGYCDTLVAILYGKKGFK
jgi:2-polyprenyl-3-methyl-5-hydroxy-6-metoxy-1,4-benzoquinol methylase